MNDGKVVKYQHVVIDRSGPGDPHIKAVGDVDGDGFPDIVIAGSNGGPLVWYGYPDWTRHVIAPSGTWSTDATLVDVDGALDIIGANWSGDYQPIEMWQQIA